MPEIETVRLRLRQFAQRDLEGYAQIYPNPKYTRYSPKGTAPLEQARTESQVAYNTTTPSGFPSCHGKSWTAFCQRRSNLRFKCSVLYITPNGLSAR